MAVRSSTKKKLMDLGVAEEYSHKLADDRKWDDVMILTSGRIAQVCGIDLGTAQEISMMMEAAKQKAACPIFIGSVIAIGINSWLRISEGSDTILSQWRSVSDGVYEAPVPEAIMMEVRDLSSEAAKLGVPEIITEGASSYAWKLRKFFKHKIAYQMRTRVIMNPTPYLDFIRDATRGGSIPLIREDGVENKADFLDRTSSMRRIARGELDGYQEGEEEVILQLVDSMEELYFAARDFERVVNSFCGIDAALDKAKDLGFFPMYSNYDYTEPFNNAFNNALDAMRDAAKPATAGIEESNEVEIVDRPFEGLGSLFG